MITRFVEILGTQAITPKWYSLRIYPDSKIHGANMGPTWVLSAPDGPHVGPMNLAIRVDYAAPKSIMVPETWFRDHYVAPLLLMIHIALNDIHTNSYSRKLYSSRIEK